MQPRPHRRDVVLGIGALLLTGCGRSLANRSGPGLWYRVQPGDSLSSIARRSSCPVGRIVEANQLSSNTLRPGVHLHLPGVDRIGPDPLAPQQPAYDEQLDLVAHRSRHHYQLCQREQWHAQGTKANHNPMGGITRITLHHTGEIPGMASPDDLSVVQAIANYHRNELGWADIGYHYLIGRNGVIYQGRPDSIQGAHSRGINNIHNLGIALLGNWHNQRPGRVQLEAAHAFLDDQQERFRIPRRRVFGHRDLTPTECPGDALYGWLHRYKSQV